MRKHASSERTTKRSLHVSVDASLIDEARSLGINFSQLLDKSLRAEIISAREQKWRAENREAIEEYNAQITEHGTFAESFRKHEAPRGNGLRSWLRSMLARLTPVARRSGIDDALKQKSRKAPTRREIQQEARELADRSYREYGAVHTADGGLEIHDFDAVMNSPQGREANEIAKRVEQYLNETRKE